MYKKFQGFCKAQNRSKTVFKYLVNRSKNRIKTVSKTYFDLLYYFKGVKTCLKRYYNVMLQLHFNS